MNSLCVGHQYKTYQILSVVDCMCVSAPVSVYIFEKIDRLDAGLLEVCKTDFVFILNSWD